MDKEPIDISGLPETPLASGRNGSDQSSRLVEEQDAAEGVTESTAPTPAQDDGVATLQTNALSVEEEVEEEEEEEEAQQSATTALLPENLAETRAPFLAEDDDMGEVSEVFVDEPEIEPSKPTRKNRRNRSKASSVTFSTNKKSYWSSDDDSTPSKRKMMASRPKSPKASSKDVALQAHVSPRPPTFPLRGKKPRSKRRMRRVQEDDQGSSSDAEPVPPQRMVSLNSPKSNQKHPIAAISVVRTKSKTTSSNQTATTATNSPNQGSRRMSSSPVVQNLSIEDMEIFQRLDDEYENALEERHIGYMARYTSVRQSAFFSVVFMLVFLGLGTTFFMRYADWTAQDSLLFSIYTITTVGYGNQAIPKESGFQSFTILYIFVGIATLTIMVAQVYQCIALETSRAQHSRDKSEMARRGLGMDILSRSGSRQQRNNNGRAHSSQASAASSVSHEPPVSYFEDWAFFDTVMHYYEQARHFFTYNETGRAFSVLLPFAGLVLVGAIVVGPLEEWSIVESLYFAVVSLTTVGFGDYYPRQTVSIWFCILWLPFSVGFMSLFLKNVATFYIRVSAQNINRIERRMRRRVARAKDQYNFERSEAMRRAYSHITPEVELCRFPSADSDDMAQVASPTKSSASESSLQMYPSSRPGGRKHGRPDQFDALPTTPEEVKRSAPVVKASKGSLFGSPGEDAGVVNRRERILKNSLEGNQDDFRPKGQTMETMKDVVKAVHKSIKSGNSDSRYLSMRSSVMKPVLGTNEPMKKPSFALRALVQERFAEIIATDIAGFQSSIEIKDNTLSVTIDSLKLTADKWCIPRRARKAFRAVAFEALYFVGEHGLITKGADALFALTPFEFHGLFSPLLAALGDAGTMEDWLASTEVLAEYDLKNKLVDADTTGDVETGDVSSRPSTAERLHTAQHRDRTENAADMQRMNPSNDFTGSTAFA